MTHISNPTQITLKSGRGIAIYSIHNFSFHCQRVKKICFSTNFLCRTQKKLAACRALNFDATDLPHSLFEALYPKPSMGTPRVALLSLIVILVVLLLFASLVLLVALRGGICPSCHCRRQCKIFASGVNFSIFTHFLCFVSLKLLKLGEIDGVKFEPENPAE